MSSGGVILNGGTAENFSLAATVAGLNQDSPADGADYDACWEPEDLVATVQFLATLDDRLPAGYVLPGIGDNQQTTDRLSPSSSIGEQVNEIDLMNSTTQDQDGHGRVIEPVIPVSDSNIPEDVTVSTVMSDMNAAAAEENSISSSAAQTPCSTEERSIIRTSNKPTHLKR